MPLKDQIKNYAKKLIESKPDGAALQTIVRARKPATYQFEDLEPRVQCLERCLGNLSAENRELILQYYQGEKGAKIENRKSLTDRFKIPLNTLRMRALRLREKLQVCVENCMEK